MKLTDYRSLWVIDLVTGLVIALGPSILGDAGKRTIRFVGGQLPSFKNSGHLENPAQLKEQLVTSSQR